MLLAQRNERYLKDTTFYVKGYCQIDNLNYVHYVRVRKTLDSLSFHVRSSHLAGFFASD